MGRPALLLALLVCGATVATAAPKKDPTVELEVERLEMARDHYQKGESLEKSGSLEAALVEYELAEVAHPSPVVAEAKKRVRATIDARRSLPAPAIAAAAPRHDGLRLRRFIAPIVLAPIALGALVAGGALTGVVASDFDHLKSTCSPACNPKDVEALKPRETAGYVLLGVGAGLAVADLVLWGVLARKPSTVHASLALDGQGGALSVQGSF